MRRKATGLRAGAGALIGLAATTGLVVGLRAVAALDLSGVRPLVALTPLPRDVLQVAWSDRAVWPAELQAAALDRMTTLVVGLFLAAASVALLNALVLLFEAGTARWREVAVRAALGAPPRALAGALVRDVRVLLTAGGATGVLLGLASGGALRAGWPGPTGPVDALAGAATLVPALALATGAAALAYAWVGLATARRGVLARTLSSGGRVTADRRAVFLRRSLSVVQTGSAGAVLMGTAVLALATRPPATAASGASASSYDEVSVLSVTRPPAADAGWGDALAALAAIPGMSAESLATPGTLVGLGVRDHVVAHCGACYRGGLPLPFWGAVADHHAVAPGFFELAGLPVTAGRAFDDRDVAGAEAVAVVNRTFAASSFEDGDPLGRRIRLGTGLDDWYTVVGVVDTPPTAAMGGDDRARAAVYLSALQRPPVHASIVVRGSGQAVRAAEAWLAGHGFGPGAPVRLDAWRAQAAAPLVWLARVAVLLGGLALVLALHGVRATALQVTRRRIPDLAVRRVVGASDARILGHVLGGAARTGIAAGLFALFFGTLGIAGLRRTAAGVPMLGPDLLGATVGLLVVATVAASVRAAREALAVDPAPALE